MKNDNRSTLEMLRGALDSATLSVIGTYIRPDAGSLLVAIAIYYLAEVIREIWGNRKND